MPHITIGDIAPRIQYVADGAQLTFAYPFPIFAAGDLEVYHDDLLVGDFTVAGAGASDGGSVTFAAAPADGMRITIRRVVPIKRVTDFQEAGEFRAKVLNDELDYQTAAIQQIADDAARALKLAPTAPIVDTVLPAPSAGKAVMWNDAGDGLVNSAEAFDSVVAQTTAQAAAAADSASAAVASATAATGSAVAAALSAAAVNLPALAGGDGAKMLRVAASENGYELRSAAQVLADIGGAAAAHDHGGIYEPADANLAKRNTAQTWTRTQTADTYALTHDTAWDGSLHQHLTVAVNGASFTIANPSAQTAKAFYAVYVSYATTHGIAWGNAFKGVASIAPTATGGKRDIFLFRSDGANLECVGHKLDIGA